MGAASNFWENKLIDGIFRRGITARVNNTAYVAGQMIYGANANAVGKVFLCVTGGTSHATTEPTWNAPNDTTPASAETTDGTAVFRAYWVGCYSPTMYLALLTAVTDAEAGTVTEATGTNYARVAVQPNGTTWRSTQGTTTFPSSGSNGTTDNNSQISFPQAGGSWGTISHVAIYDAPTAGNLLYYYDVADQAVASGNTVTFNANAITLQVDN